MARVIGAFLIISILLSGSHAIALEQRRNQADQTEADEDYGSTKNQQPVSPAFFAAILGEFRALVRQEIAKNEQEHVDRKDWNTKPFWIMFGVNVALFLVGTAYTAVAWRQLAMIKRQADLQQMALQRDRPFLSIEELTLMNFKPTSDVTTITPLAIKFKLKNNGKTAAIDISGNGIIFISDSPKRKELGDPGTQISIERTILEAGKESTDCFLLYAGGFLKDDEHRAIQTKERALIFFGNINYSEAAYAGVVKSKPYEIGFCRIYMPPAGFQLKEFFAVGDATLNYSR